MKLRTLLTALGLVTLFIACTENEDGFPTWTSPEPTAGDELNLDGYTGERCVDPGDCLGKVQPGLCQRAGCQEGECVLLPAVVGTPCSLSGEAVDCQMGVCTRVGEAASCTPTVAPDGTPCALDEWEAPYSVRTCAKGLCGPATQCAVDQDCHGLEDGDLCNGVLRCVKNACVIDPASLVDCSQAPAEICHEPICIPETGACGQKPLADDSPCEDGDLCSSGDSCQAGVCQAGSKVTNCSGVPAPQCQTSVCNPATGNCEFVAGNQGAHCADANPCMKGDYCKDGICMPGDQLVTCSQEGAGPCREAVCDTNNGNCVFINLDDSTPCDDGDKCTQTDHCSSGVCGGFNPVDCSGEEAPDCQESVCQPASGQCKLQDLEDDTLCDDGDGCTGPDKCNDGVCVPGEFVCGHSGDSLTQPDAT